MMRLAWWTCALLTLAHARIYNRCELARDLAALGVHPDHISTWVCIAYHESRFDTAANNPHSGDHGLFQISELYWCGPGKACGLPCSAFRDDDISDDLECALQVHEEHTRLQGDGFLAWVVYPHHCRHNTKKYLAECDSYPKNATYQSERRSFNTFQSYNKPNNYAVYADIDNFLPPYLTVSSIFRGSYGKMLDYNKINGVDWYNYKYDKVDELKLPVTVTQGSQRARLPEWSTPAPSAFTATTPRTRPTTPSTTTTTEYIPRIKPWRFIETNSFRKKVTETALSTPAKMYTTERYKISTTIKPSTESPTHKSRAPVDRADISVKVKSTTASYKSQTPASIIKPVNITNTAYKLPTFTTSYKSPTTKATDKFSNDVYKPFSKTTARPQLTTRIPWLWATTTRYQTTEKSVTTSANPTTKSWYTFTSRYHTSSAPTSRTYTDRTNRFSDRTIQTTEKSTTSWNSRASSRWARTRPTTSPVPITTTERLVKRTRSTQSIFDLYLNPTKAPKLPNFTFRGSNKFKLNIFSGGTTQSTVSTKT